MMKTIVAILLGVLVSTVGGFVVSPFRSSSSSSASSSSSPAFFSRRAVACSESKEDLKELAHKINPVVRYFDPLNLADWDFWGMGDEATVGFLRHSEIKHGRVAMFAFVGYIVHANGIRFPWPMTLDGTPFPTSTNPPALWDAIPEAAKLQIIGFIGFLEWWSEISTPNHKHYMAGGKPGAFPDFVVSLEKGIPHPAPNLFDPLGLWKDRSKEHKARGLRVEINNGRAAMLGIMGFLAAQTAPGSVPWLDGILPGYSGEVMAPFKQNLFEKIAAAITTHY